MHGQEVPDGPEPESGTAGPWSVGRCLSRLRKPQSVRVDQHSVGRDSERENPEPRSVLVVEPAATGFDDDHSIGGLAIGDRCGGPAEDSYRPNLRGRDLVQDLKAWRCS